MEITFTRALNESRLSHEAYQMHLRFWDKFVIWFYTIQSYTVNRYLLGMIDGEDINAWAEKLIDVYADATGNTVHSIPKKYRNFTPFFRNKNYKNKNLDYVDLLKIYVDNLQEIINNSPSLKGDIVVYKASTPYPGLKVGDVLQQPFNSTSYRVDMNYSIFLPPGGLCCMHKLLLKKGSKVLILSPLLSAYPDESEIILPYNVTFHVERVSSMILDVPIDDSNVTYTIVQDRPYSIGPIYIYNYKIDCNTEKRKIKMYESIVI